MSDFYIRLRNIACHHWGVGPWEFERAAMRGEVALEDVFEALALESAHMEVSLKHYFSLEKELKLKQRHHKVVDLARRLNGMEEGEEKEKLRAKIKRLNKPRK